VAVIIEDLAPPEENIGGTENVEFANEEGN